MSRNELPYQFGTIRSRLLFGFGFMVVLLAAAGGVGRYSLNAIAVQVNDQLMSHQREAELTATLTSATRPVVGPVIGGGRGATACVGVWPGSDVGTGGVP